MFDITPYLFLEWDAERFCCGDFVALVLKDYLDIELPRADYHGGVLQASLALKNAPARRFFTEIPQPKNFCVIEMQRFRAADHVGVCVLVDGDLQVAHCESGSGVLLSTFSEIHSTYKQIKFYEYSGL